MEPSPKITFYKARSFREVLGVTFQFLRQNLRPLGRAALLLGGPVALLGAVVKAAWLADTFGQSSGLPGVEPGSFTGLYAAMILISLTELIVLTGIVYAYIYLYIDAPDQKAGVGDVWRMTKEKLAPIASTYGWALVLGVALTLVFGAVGSLGGGPESGPLPFILLGVLLGFVLYGGLLLTLIPILRVCEPLTFWQGFARSRTLIEGYWGPTIAVVLAATLIQSLVAAFFSIPYYVLLLSAGLGAATGGEPFGSVFRLLFFVSAGFSSLISFFLYPIPLVAFAFQYFNLVERKETGALIEDMVEEEG